MVLKRMHGKAVERIPFGAPVLCRNMEVRLAPRAIANGIAGDESWRWRSGGRRIHYPGDWVTVRAIQGLGQRDLHAIARGPIMDPLALYLPAGKLTPAEYQERLDLQFREAGIRRR